MFWMFLMVSSPCFFGWFWMDDTIENQPTCPRCVVVGGKNFLGIDGPSCGSWPWSLGGLMMFNGGLNWFEHWIKMDIYGYNWYNWYDRYTMIYFHQYTMRLCHGLSGNRVPLNRWITIFRIKQLPFGGYTSAPHCWRNNEKAFVEFCWFMMVVSWWQGLSSRLPHYRCAWQTPVCSTEFERGTR